MADKIDKKIKERVKKLEKKYQEIRKKHSNISRSLNLGISLASVVCSESKEENNSPSLMEIVKEIPTDVIKKGSVDKNADVLIKKTENDTAFTKSLLMFLQDYYTKENTDHNQELHFFFEENKGVGKELAESIEIVKGQFPMLFKSIAAIASEFGYDEKPEIVSTLQQPSGTQKAVVTTKPAEVKKSVEVKKAPEVKPAEVKKPVEVKKSPEIKPTEVKKPVEVKKSSEIKPTEVKKPVEVKKVPEVKPQIIKTVESKPTPEIKTLTEKKYDEISMKMLYPLRNFLNLFNPKFCLAYSKKNIEEINPFIEVLEIPKENKILLRKNLTDFLKLIKTVIEEIKKNPNFIIFLLNAEYIGTLLEIKGIVDMLNYNLAAEDKTQISEYIIKYEFSNVQPTDCFKFWEKSTYEEKEKLVNVLLQMDNIRKDLIPIIIQINTIYPIQKILEYWNTLKDYSEIPYFEKWIQKVSS